MRDLSRREFHGLVLAGAGAALLPSCASAFDGSIALSGGRALLSFAQFPRLATAGGSAVVAVEGSFPILVVRTGAEAAVALSATCTHAGCVLRYATALNDLHCDCHDADFALDGNVLGGPTTIPLPVYPVTVGADALTVAIA